jgi:hypothetical protein
MTMTGAHEQGRRLLGLLIIATLAVAACTTEQSSEAGPAAQATPATELTTDPVESADPTTEPTCSAEELSGGDEALTFTSAHGVTAGTLGPLCFGDLDNTLIGAWDELAVISPAEKLDDIVTFGGFDSSGDEADTLAFVTVVDEEGTEFQMSVNVAAAVDDPDELLLTMAHELTHVFTATPDQLDRSLADDCPTYFNGEGCYLPGSIMAAWIDTFWYEELLAEIDPFEDSPTGEAEERCDLDAGFFGSYAATSPEEDFAESFSAYVYRLGPDSAEQQLRLDWIDAQPDLAEFRARAVDAGRGPLPNPFEICGG